MLKYDLTVLEAVKMWLGFISEIDSETGQHPEGKYFLKNVRETLLREFGDEIRPYLG
jgi:hypothetical protein